MHFFHSFVSLSHKALATFRTAAGLIQMPTDRGLTFNNKTKRSLDQL